ncbi:hypothetical protein NWF32_31235 [Pseudomonas qingdaonensis]|nr:hypothetical protein [Pseudomonas qingdaonensis]
MVDPQPAERLGLPVQKFMVSDRDVERQGLKVGPAPAVEYEDRTLGVNSPNGPRTVGAREHRPWL